MHVNGNTPPLAPSNRLTVFVPVTATHPADLHDAIDNAFAREADQAPPAPPTGPLLVTVAEAGLLLAVSESTVRGLMSRATDPLPSVKIGTARRIRRDALVAWLDRETGA